MEDNFEPLIGMMDEDVQEHNEVDEITVWNYEGDDKLFSLLDFKNGYYKFFTWHDDNFSAKSEEYFIQPTEEELIKKVKDIIK